MIALKTASGAHACTSGPPNGARFAGRGPHGPAGASPTLATSSAFAAAVARVAVAVTCAASASAAIAACANTDANQVTSPTVIAMADTTAPAYDDGQTKIYEVHTPVSLPLRRPSDDERKGLGKSDLYPHAPFLLRGDVRVEIRFTLSNLDDKDHNVELLLDPWNEFVRYVPGVIVTEEETQPNLSGYDKLVVVPAKSRLQGTITSDDTSELSVDLATAENILKNPPEDPTVAIGSMINHTFNLQNRSNDGDPLITPYIPSVIPGLTGFDLGIRTYETANVAVEIVMDVTDVSGTHVISAGATDKPIGPPGTTITPPPPPLEN